MPFDLTELHALVPQVWALSDPAHSQVRVSLGRNPQRWWRRRIRVDGVAMRQHPAVWPLFEGKEGFELTIRADGSVRFVPEYPSPHVFGYLGSGPLEIVRDPDARPPGRVASAAAQNVGPEDRDIGYLRKLFRPGDAEEVGRRRASIEEQERRSGPLPAQARAYLAVSAGHSSIDPAVPHTPLVQEFVGAGMWGPLSVKTRDPQRWAGWWRTRVDLETRHFPVGVQPAVVSEHWLPVGDPDERGMYCVDMVPGDGGTVGQLIFLPGDQCVGAQLVADSLAAAFRGDRPTPRGFLPPMTIPDHIVTCMTAAELEKRLAAGELPPTLQAVAVEDGRARLDVVNALLRYWGLPQVDAFEWTWRQELPSRPGA
ncbi:hypothetical protein [Calidifontibacter indicus]|uniref:SMI1/KNR4 family protein SUKH-1 n=1 Tax=Calidifontibacter indicus TaxID=419650 RepID=A0A3D9UST5_9MICO|nr:hypothetical protein [Calidifontibacter indicus]REF29705.1 hypothetical protein DFJ65_0672 [Calidifontibacter indicus]